MSRKGVLLGLLLLVSMWLHGFEPHFAKDPDISPDGKEVCFIYKGDLWKVPFEGGVAIRLTDTKAPNYEPQYSPDGKNIAFVSSRDGYRAIYLIPANGGEITQVSAAGYGLLSWFPDGKSLLGSSYDTRLGMGFHRITLDGKRPQEITLVGGPFATVSNDGNSIVYSDRGHPYREAYRGSTNGELWKYDIKKGEYERLTDTEVTERYPVFSSINEQRLYYAKSDGEIFQLYRADNYDFKNEVQLTNFSTWSVRDISIARNSNRMVFEKFNEIWSYDDSSASKQKAKKLNIEIREVIENGSMVRERVQNGFGDFEVSSDDKFMVFNYEYDLFLIPVEGGAVKQVTHNQMPIDGLKILNDNKTVVFNGRERGEGHLYKFSLDKIDKIEQIGWSKNIAITSVSETERGNYLIRYYLDKKEQRLALTDSLFSSFQPLEFNDYILNSYADRKNSRYIAYTDYDIEKGVFYLYLRDTQINESYLLYNSYKSFYNLTWGNDDRTLFITESGNIKRVDLYPYTDLADYKDPWQEILSEPSKSDSKKGADSEKREEYPELRLELKGVESRITTIVDLPGYNYILAVENDTTFYFVNSAATTTIYKTNYKGKNREQIDSISDRNYYSFNKKSMTYYYNPGDMIHSVNLKSRAKSKVGNDFFYEYDLDDVRRQVFREVWGQFGLNFYDADMHGVNWEELYRKYEPYIEYCQDEEVLSNIIDEMIGEVNASHTGFSPKQRTENYYYTSGYLGAEFDFSQRLKKGIKFRKIFDSTLLKDVYKIEPGDLLLAINDHEITDSTDIEKLLFNTQKKKLKLTIKQGRKDLRELYVEGLTWREHNDLEYNDWVNSRREIVQDKSESKIGYLHIQRMNGASYSKFLEDFWNDNIKKDGLIIDVRGNGGGNISEELVEAISQKPLSYTSFRGLKGQKYKTPKRFYEKPIVVLIDEDSFSDAEVFPHLVQEQKLGTIIGMPTSGSVIGTFDIDLFDGSSLRIPRSGWWTLSGTNMEGNGVQPDIRVELTPADKLYDNDRQLDRAIDYLLSK